MTPGLDQIDVVFAFVDIGIAAIVTAFSLAVVWFYARALKVAPRDRGLLLWHIVCVASGVSGVLVFKALGQLDFLGLADVPRWVRGAGYAFFETLIGAAIIIIALEQRRRVTKKAPETVVSRRDVTVFDSDSDDHGAAGGGSGG